MKFFYTTFLALSFAGLEAMAEKAVYIPREWQNRNDTLIYSESDPDNKYTWSKSRSKETENYIVYWDNKYGNTSPTNAESTYRVDIDDLLSKCEGFYAMNVGKLAFCDEKNSNVSKYKMMVLLNHTTEWVCYGGGYDDVIGALWLSPSTSKPVGHSVGHEVGHSFQYQVFADIKGYSGFRTAIGSGSTFWEQTAQWQANQSYPELKWEQSWNLFKNTHNYAMTHEWHRYQSYWWHYYLTEKFGIDYIGKLWRYNPGKGVDPNQSLMSMSGMSSDDLYDEFFHYAMKCATMDFDVARDEVAPYIGSMKYEYVSLGGTKHQVSYSSCPQSTGFNIIPLNVAKAGTEVVTKFTSLPNGSALATGDSKKYFDGDKFADVSANTYNSISNYSKRGFRIGYVALLKNGERKYMFEDEVYCTGGNESEENSCEVSCIVPENTDRLFLVVSPAPAEYIQHKWDENILNDDQWPYTVEFTNTNIYGAADISADKSISDVTLEYDVYFPASATDYVGLRFKLDGQSLSSLGTAFQMQSSSLGGVMTEWSNAGPSDGKAMFYAVDSNGQINNSASSANGYGHWFDNKGNKCAFSSGYFFSEFDAQSLTFSLGQYPGKMSNGASTKISQAIRYQKNGKTVVATFVFNIHLSADRTGCELISGNNPSKLVFIPTDKVVPVAVYSVTGVQTNELQRGVNIIQMSDGTVKKVIKK